MRGRGVRHRILALTVCLLTFAPLHAQVIEFRSNGLNYQALTKRGMTVMYARMPITTGRYFVLQVALSNGSADIWEVLARDFFFETTDGHTVRAASEQAVVDDFFRNAGRTEMLELQTVYEKALYNNEHIRSNNGYEQRRQSALAFGPKGLKAAAAASSKSAPLDSRVWRPVSGVPAGRGGQSPDPGAREREPARIPHPGTASPLPRLSEPEQ